MNKNDLAREIASRMSVTVTMASQLVDTLCAVVGESIRKDESVLLQNFGHFQPWQQKERFGRNPRTGVECPIRKRVSVKFKPGTGLLELFNEKHEDTDICDYFEAIRRSPGVYLERDRPVCLYGCRAGGSGRRIPAFTGRNGATV